jgi:ERCC4-type nuclease
MGKTMILISPSEPMVLRQALEATNSPLCEEKGADILAPTRKGLLGIQRKEAPSDFLASLEDGRLARELPLLHLGADFPILLLEGTFNYDAGGRLSIDGRPTRYNRSGIKNLLRSVFYTHGIVVERSENLSDTPNVVRELVDYLSHDHTSLLNRPKLQVVWGKPTSDQQHCYFYQGMPGVGVVLAQSLTSVFPTPADLVKASLEDLKALPQIGKQRAGRIHAFLHDDSDVKSEMASTANKSGEISVQEESQKSPGDQMNKMPIDQSSNGKKSISFPTGNATADSLDLDF